MLKIPVDNGFFWLGIHDTVGLVIYDPLCQQGESKEWCRLFVLEESRFGEFVKDVVRGEIKGASETVLFRDSNAELIESTIASWVKIRRRIIALSGRKTHCRGCGRDLAGYKYPVCPKCFWIKCNCGGCGCGYAPQS